MSTAHGSTLARPSAPLQDRLRARLSGLDALPPPFGCDVFPEGLHVRVAPIGELDMATTPELERTIRQLLELGFDRLTLDLAQVSFADARLLRLILDLDASRQVGELTLTLLPGPDEVQRLFEVTGTLARLPFR
jgi:anti-anti-sigma factor